MKRDKVAKEFFCTVHVFDTSKTGQLKEGVGTDVLFPQTTSLNMFKHNIISALKDLKLTTLRRSSTVRTYLSC